MITLMDRVHTKDMVLSKSSNISTRYGHNEGIPNKKIPLEKKCEFLILSCNLSIVHQFPLEGESFYGDNNS